MVTDMLNRTYRSTTLLAVLVAVLAAGVSGCGSDEKDPTSSDPVVNTNKERAAPAERADPDVEVEPGIGIAGVRVGDDVAAVERELGKADKRTTGTSEISGTEQERLEFNDAHIEVVVGEDVSQVETTDREARTDSGVGIGSSRAEVVSAYPEVSCDAEGGAGEPAICRLGAEEAGAVTTDFFIEGGSVTRIVVGRIHD